MLTNRTLYTALFVTSMTAVSCGGSGGDEPAVTPDARVKVIEPINQQFLPQCAAPEKTALVRSIDNPIDVVEFNGQTYLIGFSIQGDDYHKYNVNTGEATAVTSTPWLEHLRSIGEAAPYNGEYYFTKPFGSLEPAILAYNAANDTERDIPDPEGIELRINEKIVVDGRLFFAAEFDRLDNSSGFTDNELWSYDAASGKFTEYQIAPEQDRSSSPNNFHVIGSSLFFRADQANSLSEVVEFDTRNDTWNVISNLSSTGTYAESLHVANGRVYFMGQVDLPVRGATTHLLEYDPQSKTLTDLTPDVDSSLGARLGIRSNSQALFWIMSNALEQAEPSGLDDYLYRLEFQSGEITMYDLSNFNFRGTEHWHVQGELVTLFVNADAFTGSEFAKSTSDVFVIDTNADQMQEFDLVADFTSKPKGVQLINSRLVFSAESPFTDEFGTNTRSVDLWRMDYSCF